MPPTNYQNIYINFNQMDIKRDAEITFRYLVKIISQYKKRLRVRRPSKKRRFRLPSDSIILSPGETIFEVPLSIPTNYLKNLKMTFIHTNQGIGLSCIIPHIKFTTPPKSMRCENIHALSSRKLARRIVYDWMVEDIMES
jgi:hypothetical protein